jgi:hypothetical protein
MASAAHTHAHSIGVPFISHGWVCFLLPKGTRHSLSPDGYLRSGEYLFMTAGTHDAHHWRFYSYDGGSIYCFFVKRRESFIASPSSVCFSPNPASPCVYVRGSNAFWMFVEHSHLAFFTSCAMALALLPWSYSVLHVLWQA